VAANSMQAALVIFDLDGTLIDSAADLHCAVNRMLSDFGCDPLPLGKVRSMVGDGAAMLISRALAARQCAAPDPAEALQRFLNHYEAEPTTFTQLYPGVHATLESLRARGVPLAICTNKPAHLTNRILKKLGIEAHFGRVIGGDTLPFRKPDPRTLLELLNGLGAAAAASLMVGDSEVDAETAHAAGVPFALMTYGYHRGPIDRISRVAAFDRFPELADFIAA
jgi:phosphoglycolate phosphatase